MTHRRVLMVNITAMMVVDADEDFDVFEQNISGALHATPGVHHSQLQDVMIDPLADHAFCCPICGSPIEATAHINGSYESVLDMASGTPVDGHFSGDEVRSYACSSDSSHDVSDAVAPLRTTPLTDVNDS